MNVPKWVGDALDLFIDCVSIMGIIAGIVVVLIRVF